MHSGAIILQMGRLKAREVKISASQKRTVQEEIRRSKNEEPVSNVWEGDTREIGYLKESARSQTGVKLSMPLSNQTMHWAISNGRRALVG